MTMLRGAPASLLIPCSDTQATCCFPCFILKAHAPHAHLHVASCWAGGCLGRGACLGSSQDALHLPHHLHACIVVPTASLIMAGLPAPCAMASAANMATRPTCTMPRRQTTVFLLWFSVVALM